MIIDTLSICEQCQKLTEASEAERTPFLAFRMSVAKLGTNLGAFRFSVLPGSYFGNNFCELCGQKAGTRADCDVVVTWAACSSCGYRPINEGDTCQQCKGAENAN